MDSGCAHWDIQVRWLMICWWPCHKYYITILYLKLPWYCWNYKSNLNINIQELYIIQGNDYSSTARWSNSHNTVYELSTRSHFIPCFNLRLSVSRGTSAHRAATHIGIPSRCNCTTLIISSLHHNLGMFAN